ncbi:class A beta-lactamase, subclass A2 [Adhaeribacter aquaticus]|uniref:class A beta-lactamase, subclass A2 n=1 Tax=Adhaeribacter aquaticus TaxID=299567 RepID=UPI0003FC79A0|nr:class A beta-lactamase, subclass A2 [Adhaeribacter aquaticus]
MLHLLLTGLIYCSVQVAVFAQTGALKRNIEDLIASKDATVGVAIYGLESKDAIYINNNKHFPLQSVFKFHIALAVLSEVDRGRLTLNQKIRIKKSDLLPNTWSPIREKYPQGNVELPLTEVLKYTVAESDNNGCDILLRLIGGTQFVNNYLHKLGIKEVSIQANEAEMHQAWDVQFQNWTTPKSTVDLLKLFQERKILSAKSYDFLWQTMAETVSGKNRIKGQLPAGTVVAHKTGTSGTNDQGITAAINDIGLVTLPNGTHFAISVLVSNSKESTETNEKIIADITKLSWNYFTSGI